MRHWREKRKAEKVGAGSREERADGGVSNGSSWLEALTLADDDGALQVPLALDRSV